MIAEESIERVKSDASILEVVGETVQLKRAGQYYTGLCPFHAEKSPSFFVRDSTNTYTCYGCGTSGNVISFVMATRAMTFPDAVEYLASRFKIELKYTKGSKQGPSVDREKLFSITRAAQIFFRRALSQVKGGAGEFRTVGEYLRKRGLTSEGINTFGVGYAPRQRGILIEALRGAGFDDESITSTGLVRRNAGGEMYELFRGRLMFPIFVDSQRIAGFGGRLVPGVQEKDFEDQSPKYINSPETPIYHKSKTVYGLPQALESARAAKELYVVEGYMDVVGLWQAGVRNAVACCGTAMTEQHVKRFAGVCNKVHLLFDGDGAGRGAAAKAFTAARNAEVDIDVCFLPEGEDPDDFARRQKSNASEALRGLNHAQLIDVYIDSLLARYGCAPTERPGPNLLGRLCDEVAKALMGVEREIVRTSLLEHSARRLSVSPDQLHRLVGREGGSNRIDTVPAEASFSPQRAGDSSRTGGIVPIERPKGYAPRDQNGSGALPSLDKALLQPVMVLKEQILPDLLSRDVLADGLRADTVEFITEFNRILAEYPDEIERRIAVKELLSRFGRSWIELWKEAYRMQQDPQVDMNAAYSQTLESLARQRLDREISRLQEELERHRGTPEEIVLSGRMLALIARRKAPFRGVDLPASNS